MKNKQAKKFKVIPFCISLLIVILITGGIGVYTTFYYGQADVKFLSGYLGVEENENLSSAEYINKALELETKGYIDAPESIKLNFRDAKTKNNYGPEKFESISQGNVANYFKDGVMHVEGYFDISLKILLTEEKNSKGEIEQSYTYVFYLYNIDYTKMGFENTVDPQDRIRIAFVEGVDSRNEDQYTDDESYLGDVALKEMMDDETYEGDLAVLSFTYGYYNEKKGVSGNYPVYDRGATVDTEKMEITSANDPVCVLKSSLYNNSEGKYFDELEAVTFSIYVLNEEETKHTTIVEGTVENILSSEEKITAS